MPTLSVNNPTSQSGQSGTPFLDETIPLIQNYSPQKIFAVQAGRSITQAEFLSELEALLPHMPRSDYAINLCEDRYYFLLTFCALLLNKTINLLPANRQALTVSELSKHYGDCCCIVDKPTSEYSSATDVAQVFHSRSTQVHLNNPATISASPKIFSAQVAAIAFTSGSTGQPKPNTKYFGTLAATARLLGQRLTAHLSQPTLIATVPSQHMYGLETTVMMALQAGIILNTEKPFFPADVQTALQSIEPPRVLVTTPTHLRAIVKSQLQMPEVAEIISATAPLDLSLAADAESNFRARLSEIYGCTEAGSLATRQSTQTQTWELLDSYELLAQQSSSASSVAVASPFWLGPIPLQDHIEWLSAHHFLLHGRGTDMINVAGKRASLSDLSLQLQRIPGVQDAVVFLPEFTASAHAQSHQPELRPAAFIVSNSSEKEILAELAARIDPAFIPRPLIKVAALPRNETGKITTKELQQLWKQIRESK